MPLAILGQYEIQKCLGRHDHAAVYEATNREGGRVIVKFLFDPDAFFDEMARHYAVDECVHACKLLENYPPYEVTGDPFMFRMGLATLFDMDHFADRIISTEEMRLSPLADMGALVFEHVEGRRLAEILTEVDIQEGLERLVHLCRAVHALHVCGECHGDLIVPNVLVERSTHHIKLLDLGYCAKKELPDGQYRAPNQGRSEEPLPADDVYMLARNFMGLVPCEEALYIKLREQAVAEDPGQRPDLLEMVHQLEGIAGMQVTLVASAPPERRPVFRPQYAMAAVFCVFLTAALYWVNRDAGAVHEENGREVLSQARSRQRVIARQRVQQNSAVLVPDMADFATPIAVFAHREEPLLIGRRHIYRLGDQVLLNDRQGTIAGIDFEQLVVESRNQLVNYHFQKPGYKSEVPADGSGWLVWQNSRNLPRLLGASASLVRGWQNTTELELSTLLSHHRNAVHIAADSVYGYYPGTGPQHFLMLLEQQLNVVPEGSGWRVGLREDMHPLYLSFRHFLVEDITVKGFCEYLGKCTGLEVVCPPHLEDHQLPRQLFFDISWQGVLDALNFEWSLQDDAEGGRVMIRAMNI